MSNAAIQIKRILEVLVGSFFFGFGCYFGYRVGMKFYEFLF